MKDEVTKLQEYRSEVKTESESRISRCCCCGKEIPFGRIFCDVCNTPINKQIFEFFSQFPKNKDGVLIRPRGEKLYQVIKYYLAAKLRVNEDKRIIMKSCTGAGKSVMLDMLAFIEMTHFPNSLTIIGSISEAVSKMHIERLREWIGDSVFNRYMVGTQEATASKTEIKLAKLNSKVMAMPQSPKSRTGWHASLLLVDEIGRMEVQSYYASFSQMAAQGGTEVLACFDEETEILCNSGFKNIKDVGYEDSIATYNLKTQDLEYQIPNEIFNYDYDDEMIEIISKGINLLVTPEHKLFTLSSKSWKKRNFKCYRSMEAQKFLQYGKFGEHYIPLTSKPQIGRELQEFHFPKLRISYGGWGNGHHIYPAFSIPMDLWLEFLGYYLSEGWIEKNRVGIAQIKFRDEMQHCCEELAFHLNRKCQINKKSFRISSRQLNEILSGDKRIPSYVFECSIRQRKIFLEAFNLGDGLIKHHQENGGFIFYLNARKEEKLSDDFQRLFLSIGMSTTRTIEKEKGKITIFGNKKTHGIIYNRSGKIKKKAYKGKVFGFSLPNQTLFARRKGRVFVSGNSTPYLDSIVMQNIWASDDIVKIDLEPEECFWIPEEVFRKKEDEYRIGGYSALYDQLYGAQFRSLTNRVIPDDLLLQSMAKSEHYQTSKNLIMGIDFGKSIDFTAIVVLDIETGDVKFVDTFQDDWPIQFAKIRKYVKEWDPIKIIADSSHIGDVILSDLRDLNIEGISMHNDILKKSVIDRLILAFFNNKLNIVSDEFPKLINEISSYVYYDSEHKKMGPSGRGHDDCVVALSLALRGLDVTSVSNNPLLDNLWSFTRIGGASSTNPWAISNV